MLDYQVTIIKFIKIQRFYLRDNKGYLKNYDLINKFKLMKKNSVISSKS